jgi:hypothetical protein
MQTGSATEIKKLRQGHYSVLDVITFADYYPNKKRGYPFETASFNFTLFTILPH